MNVIDFTSSLLKEDEGFVSKPYIDPLRLKNPEKYGLDSEKVKDCNLFFDKLVVTFGYGFTYISEDEANVVLEMRLKDLYEFQLTKLIKDIKSHPVEIQGVFLCMLYQLGFGSLSKFKKTLKYLSERNYCKVSSEMLDSNWARETYKRAVKLSNIVKKYC